MVIESSFLMRRLIFDKRLFYHHLIDVVSILILFRFSHTRLVISYHLSFAYASERLIHINRQWNVYLATQSTPPPSLSQSILLQLEKKSYSRLPNIKFTTHTCLHVKNVPFLLCTFLFLPNAWKALAAYIFVPACN